MRILTIEEANVGHAQHQLLPTIEGLANASLFISELLTSGQIRNTRQGTDPEILEEEAAAALEAIAKAQVIVSRQAEECLQEYLSRCKTGS